VLHDPAPDAKTIWLFREQLTQAAALERLFARFDVALRDADYLAMGSQNATAVQARRSRLTEDEKASKVVRCRTIGRRPSGCRWTPTAAGP
jgi:IS5 family transposase